MNLKAVEGAIRSLKTPIRLKEGLIRKYGKQLGIKGNTIPTKMLDYRESLPKGSIMKPSTFERIKRSAASKYRGKGIGKKVAGSAYWKTLKAKYRKSGKKNPIQGLSDEQYKQREWQIAYKRRQEIEKAPLSERKEACAELLQACKEYPEVVAERIGWLLNGSYGRGQYDMALRDVEGWKKNKNTNLNARLFNLVAIYEWYCPHANQVYNKLTQIEKDVLNAEITKELREGEYLTKKNPGAAWHEHARACAEKRAQQYKDDGIPLQAARYSGMAFAHGISERVSKAMHMNPYYLGIKGSLGHIFTSRTKPTRQSHGSKFSKVVGPFNHLNKVGAYANKIGVMINNAPSSDSCVNPVTKSIQFIANAVRWFDKVNGNTYHSVRIIRLKDNQTIVSGPMHYGYGNSYRQTALEIMFEHKWLPKKYGEELPNGSKKLYLYERENNYPISWNVQDSLKRDMIRNGMISNAPSGDYKPLIIKFAKIIGKPTNKWKTKDIIAFEKYVEHRGMRGENPHRCNPHTPKGAVRIYDKIEAIEAVKGDDSLWPKEKFRHDFKGKSHAEVYGLPDGALLIKSKTGKRLHKKFNYPNKHRKNPQGKDIVIFRRYSKKNGGGVIALLPEAEVNRGNIGSYEHVGQHSEAGYPYILTITKPANINDADVQDLLAELKSIGYVPIVKQKVNYDTLLKSWNWK